MYGNTAIFSVILSEEVLPGGGEEISAPLLPENGAKIMPAPLNYSLVLPIIIYCCSLKVIQFLPSSLKY